jgi:membrane protein DedA with SNARE-associated domain
VGGARTKPRRGSALNAAAAALACAHAAVLIAPLDGTQSAEPVVLLLAGAPLSVAAGYVASRGALVWLPLPAAALLVVWGYASPTEGDRGPLDPVLLAAFFTVACGAAALLGHVLARMFRFPRRLRER